MGKYDEEYKKIGMNISSYRKKMKMNQEELANKVGISYSYLTQIEAPNVIKKMSLEVLLDIASALNVDINKLL